MRKKIFLIISIVFLVTLSGCWDKKELSELAITTAIGIDKKDDRYIVSSQVINPGEITGDNISNLTPVSTYVVDGQSVSEAIRNMTTEAPRRIYLSHVRIVVIGEELAKEGVKQVLDFLSRYHETRTDFYIVVTKGHKAEEILSILTTIEKIPANKIFGSIEISEKLLSSTKGIQLDDLISKIISEGNNPVLTGITFKGDLEIGETIHNAEQVQFPTVLQLANLAVLKGDKLVGWLNSDETKGFNFIENNIKETVGVIRCEEDDGNVTIHFYDTSTKVNGTFQKGKPKITIEVNSEIRIEEVSKCKRMVSEEKTIKWLEEEINKQTKENILASINKAKELKSDIFGFGDSINRKEPKEWKKIKDGWDDDIFPNLEVEVKTETTLRRLGTIIDSFQEKGEN